MSEYRRSLVPGGTFFFTVTLADRRSQILLDNIDRLRHVYRRVQEKYPFETIAVCILPEHLHAIWTLPPNDADYSLRWNLIKAGFSRGLRLAGNVAQAKYNIVEKDLGKDDFWSTKFGMKKIYNNMWIMCISIR